jgi:hypothetical protein
MQYLCFGRNSSLEVPNLRKKFCHKGIQSNLLDPKWSFEALRSILQTLDTKKHAILVFRGGMHYFVVPNFYKCVAMNASILTFQTQNEVWNCFRAFRKPSRGKIMQHLCFGRNALFWGTNLSKKVLPRTHPIYTFRPKTMFGSVSKHFAYLRHEKSCNTCVSVRNAQSRGYWTSIKSFHTNASNLTW